jgi:hypothetical protein
VTGQDDRDYGRRFLDEYRKLGGDTVGWPASFVSTLEGADRAGTTSLLYPHETDLNRATIECARTQPPSELARMVLEELAAIAGDPSACFPFFIL